MSVGYGIITDVVSRSHSLLEVVSVAFRREGEGALSGDTWGVRGRGPTIGSESSSSRPPEMPWSMGSRILGGTPHGPGVTLLMRPAKTRLSEVHRGTEEGGRVPISHPTVPETLCLESPRLRDGSPVVVQGRFPSHPS